MKTIFQSHRTSLLAAGSLALGASLIAQPAEPDPENYIEVGGGGAWVDGDAAAFQARSGLARNGFGGITDFRISEGDGKFVAEGHLLAGNNDYLVKLLYAPNEKLTLKLAYKEFRTWYDGSGGYVPYAEEFSGASSLNYRHTFYALDRTEFSAEAIYKPIAALSLRLKYTHSERDGQKDSTSHADTNLTRIPNVSGVSVGPTRSIVPSYYDIDETRDVVEADATYQQDGTTVNAGLRWENAKVDNTRQERRRPGESASRYLSHNDESDTDLFALRGSALQQVSEQLTLSASYIYTKLDADIGGSRIFGSSFDAEFDPVYQNRQARDEGYYHLEDFAQIRQHVGQLSAMYSPKETLHFVGSLRLEREHRESIDEFIETNVATSPAGAPAVGVHAEAESERHWDDLTGSIEARYTGLARWVFTARAEASEGDGSIDEFLDGDLRDAEYHRWTERYGLTANWYPASKVNVSVLAGRKERTNDFDTLFDSAASSSDRYPAYIKRQSLTTDDVAIRLTLRPLPGVTSVTRVDLQSTDIDSLEVGLGDVRSADLSTRVVSQSLSWAPVSRLYLQGSINWVHDEVDTPADLATGSAAGIVTDSENDYWNATVTVGFVADDATDVLLTYETGKVDNWIDNSAITVPYGIKSDEDTVQLAVTRRINRNLRVKMKYAYTEYDEPSAGGFNDYTAHALVTQLQYRF